MQVSDSELTDAQLAVLLDPEGRSVSVRIEDTPGRLVARPRGFPLWFVLFSLALPLGAYAGLLVNEALPQQLDPLHLVGLPIGCVAALFIVALIYRMNQRQVSKGDFFVLDEDRKMLILPRRGLRIQHGQVRGVVEVHAWHTVWDGPEAHSDWLGELSVLVSTDHGELARYPVITCLRTGAVTKVGKVLADFFGVERRFLKVNWKTRRRLRTEGGGGA
jgi:hypothetical protein